jgi:hypothetical protein
MQNKSNLYNRVVEIFKNDSSSLSNALQIFNFVSTDYTPSSYIVYFSIISYTQAYKLYSSMAFEARQSGFYTRLCLF